MIDLTIYLSMAAIVNRLTELVKASFDANVSLSPENRRVIALAISLFLGVVVVIGAGGEANIFAGNAVYGRISPVVGQILTGLFVGAGANAVHWIADLLYGYRQPPTTVAVSTPSTSVTVREESKIAPDLTYG